MSSRVDSTAIEDKIDGISISDEEALEMHRSGRPGKIEITPTKPLTTQRDLSLAYSPGVAAPCLAIQATTRPRCTSTPPRAISWR